MWAISIEKSIIITHTRIPSNTMFQIYLYCLFSVEEKVTEKYKDV